MEEKKILEKLREICLALPKTSETTTFGHPTFQVGTKTFTVLETYKGVLSTDRRLRSLRYGPVELKGFEK